MKITDKLEVIYAFMGGKSQPVRPTLGGHEQLCTHQFDHKRQCLDFCRRELNNKKFRALDDMKQPDYRPVPVATIYNKSDHRLKYDVSVDALMPVLKKIESMGYVLMMTKDNICFKHREKPSIAG